MMTGDDINIARKLSVYNHRKKQAANDAQLLMNRVALLQKEEERARKKIDQTKERAMEIIAMRDENERRLQSYIEMSNEERAMQREMQEKIKEQEMETKRNLAMQSQKILEKRREDVAHMNTETKFLTKQLLKEQEKDLRIKQKKRNDVRRMEEEARLKRDEEKRESERKMREHYEAKAAAEEAEVRRAEKLVKALEKKEREWMQKLQDAQRIQEAAFEHLEYALVKDTAQSVTSRGGGGGVSAQGSPTGSREGGFSGSSDKKLSVSGSGSSKSASASGDKPRRRSASSTRPRGSAK